MRPERAYLGQVAIVAGALGMLIGGGHVVAWMGGLMPQGPSTTITMKTNTGLGLVLCGLALILLARQNPQGRSRRAAQVCAAIVLILGLTTLSEHIFGFNAGIDQLLATEQPGAAATASPNRMGPPASLSFILLGTALLLLSRSRVSGRGRSRHQPFAVIVVVLGLLSIIGYLYGASALYDIARSTHVAWPTALALFILGVGVLCADPHVGLMARVTANDPGGAITRALLGPMVITPLVLGWVRLTGERLGWFDAPMGTGLMMLVFIVTFSSLLLFASWRVSLASAALRNSEQETRHQMDLLAVTLASIGDAVIVTDVAGTVTFLNGEGERLTGWSHGDAGTRPLTDVFRIVNAESREPVESPAEKVLCLGAVIGLGNDTVLLAKDGREIPIDGSGAPVRQPDGAVRGVMLVFRDITERKRAQEALAESQRVYRSIGESIDYGVWVCAPDGRNIYASESFLKLVGMTQEQCSNFGWGDVLHPDDAEYTIAAWKECVRTEGRWDIEHRFRGVDGRWHPILARGVPVRNDKGEITCWAGINLDIAKLKETEHALREADRRKNEFLAVLSHELRNPLAAVRTAVHLLGRLPPVGEQAKRARDVIDRQSAQLGRLVDDLLDVTRISRGKVQLHREPVELTGLVRRTAEDHRALFAKSGIDFDVQVPAEPVWTDADGHRLAQVMGNLLHNAVKFTDRGGRATIRLSLDDSAVAVVSVCDSGVGVSPHVLPQIFEPFVQVEDTLHRARGGLGLGLTLVKSLVEMHDGSVSAQSDGVGRGSEFTVRLPIRPVTPAGPPSMSCGGQMRRRVLIIEDNIDAADSLRQALDLAGHEVEVAYDGADGLEKARRFLPEVVLCDIGLPGLNGYEVARTMRQDPALASASLVALTGYALEEDVTKAHEAGFDLHLAKPPSPESLQKALSAARRTGTRPR